MAYFTSVAGKIFHGSASASMTMSSTGHFYTLMKNAGTVLKRLNRFAESSESDLFIDYDKHESVFLSLVYVCGIVSLMLVIIVKLSLDWHFDKQRRTVFDSLKSLSKLSVSNIVQRLNDQSGKYRGDTENQMNPQEESALRVLSTPIHSSDHRENAVIEKLLFGVILILGIANIAVQHVTYRNVSSTLKGMCPLYWCIADINSDFCVSLMYFLRMGVRSDPSLGALVKDKAPDLYKWATEMLPYSSGDLSNLRYNMIGSGRRGVGFLGEDFLDMFLNEPQGCDRSVPSSCLSYDNSLSYFLTHFYIMWTAFEKVTFSNTLNLNETFDWLLGESEAFMEKAMDRVSNKLEELVAFQIRQMVILPVTVFCVVGFVCGILLLPVFISRVNNVYSFLSLVRFCEPEAIMQSKRLFKILSNDFSTNEADEFNFSDTLNETICANYYDSVFLLDNSLAVLSVNQQAVETFGQDIRGRNVTRVLNCGGPGTVSLKEFETALEYALHGLRSPCMERTLEIKTAEETLTFQLVLTALNTSGEIQKKPTVTDRIAILILILKDQTKSLLARHILRDEEEKIQRLLSSVLPARILQRRSAGEQNIFHSVSSACFIYIDFLGFQCTADSVLLHERLMAVFDSILGRYFDLTRIKSVANAYMAAGGLFGETVHACVRDTVAAGLEMLSSLDLFNMETHSSVQISVVVTIGGPVFSGVLELSCPTFEVFGIPFHQIEELRKVSVPRAIVIPSSVYDFIYSDGFGIRELRIPDSPTTVYIVQ
jgi:hypothetical protein